MAASLFQPEDSIRALLVDDRKRRRQSLEQSLQAIGCVVVGYAALDDDLPRLVEQLAPDIVIMDMDAPGRDSLDSLGRMQSHFPRPVVMFTQDDNGETIRRAVRAGVTAYVVDGLKSHRVRPIIETAIARFEQFQALEKELESARTQLAERKLIDKAKGLIMKQRGVPEDAAYQAMRKLAMSSNKRMVEIAEQVVAAAELLL